MNYSCLVCFQVRWNDPDCHHDTSTQYVISPVTANEEDYHSIHIELYITCLATDYSRAFREEMILYLPAFLDFHYMQEGNG